MAATALAMPPQFHAPQQFVRLVTRAAPEITGYRLPTVTNVTPLMASPLIYPEPVFVSRDRAALLAGVPLDRPMELRELAMRVLESQQQSGRPTDVEAWARQLAQDSIDVGD